MARRPPRRDRKAQLSPTAYAVMTDGPMPEGDDFDLIQQCLLHPHSDAGRELWREHGRGIVQRHAEKRPGTRPTWWWWLDAPKWQTDDPRYVGWWFSGHLAEPRQRVGGTGTPAHEVLAYAPSWPLGVPLYWCDVDPADPPRYESQASYLRRHGLFLEGEEARLSEADFQPETVDPDDLALSRRAG